MVVTPIPHLGLEGSAKGKVKKSISEHDDPVVGSRGALIVTGAIVGLVLLGTIATLVAKKRT